jgi:hypothetical protein
MQVKKADARLDQSGKMDGANYLGRRFLYVHATLSTQASNRNLPWKFVDPRQGVWTNFVVPGIVLRSLR